MSPQQAGRGSFERHALLAGAIALNVTGCASLYSTEVAPPLHDLSAGKPSQGSQHASLRDGLSYYMPKKDLTITITVTIPKPPPRSGAGSNTAATEQETKPNTTQSLRSRRGRRKHIRIFPITTLQRTDSI